MPKPMHLCGFLIAGPVVHSHAIWRNPAHETPFLSLDHYVRIARLLEQGCFDFLFFADRLAIADRYGDSHAAGLARGDQDATRMDPMPILGAMAAVTRHIGLGATRSTTYDAPYNIAREFATLDHISGGRAAWNVVTSMNDGEALNFGTVPHLGHDERYDRADEFMEVVMGHWDTWEDDAIVADKAQGLFADPQKVHRLDHAGPYFRSRGPLPVPRSPQGHPVILQAGQSGRGLAFASRWAELVFAKYPTLDNGRKQYRTLKDGIASAGRDPDSVKIAPELKIIVAETESLAREKRDLIASLSRPVDGLTMMGETLNIDFSGRPYEQPFTDEELAAMSWQSLRDKVIQVSGKQHPSVRDFVESSGRGTLNDGPCFVGTGEQVADQMAEWFETACDGFVLSGTTVPGTYEDIVRLVVPQLQKRGLFRTEYEGSTLRQNVGLARPRAGDWKRGNR